MQKAIYFEEAFKNGMLSEVDSGYILSIRTPDMDDINSMNDPILIEMISYSGVKSVIPIGDGVKYQAQGKKMFCMLEPIAYTEKHIEPTFRKQHKTGFMPFRFSDCDTFLTKDNKLNVLIPQLAQDCFDSFTVTFPEKGDLTILYLIFDKDINGIVLPFIQENFQTIINKMLGLREIDCKTIAKKFIEVVLKYDIWPD